MSCTGEPMMPDDGASEAGEKLVVDRDRIERAVAGTARLMTRYLAEAFYGRGAEKMNQVEPEGDFFRDLASAEQNAVIIRKTTRRFGADLIGICESDSRWFYRQGEELGDYRWTVVMAVAMDAAAIRRSPSGGASASTYIGYTRMAQVASLVGIFIRKLGFRAIASGNGEALSVPLACEAGLGECGRNGMLLTKEFGPCVRLCKVFTDMPLAADKPERNTELTDFCATCDRCARACPAGAVDSTRGSSPQPLGDSSIVRRWRVDNAKCRAHWRKGGHGCAACIAACPLSPGAALLSG